MSGTSESYNRVNLTLAGVETDVLHLDMMGSHLVVLSSSDAAAELLDRRSAIYSDRVRKK